MEMEANCLITAYGNGHVTPKSSLNILLTLATDC